MSQPDEISYLKKATGMLQARGFTLQERIQDKLEDKGTAYLRFSRDDAQFYVRAKEYVYQGKSPFGMEMVEDALSVNAKLVIYYDDIESLFVFDPGFVSNYGKKTTGQSKHSEARPYLEVDLDHGAAIDDFIEGDVTPKTSIPSQTKRQRDNTINSSLDQYL